MNAPALKSVRDLHSMPFRGPGRMPVFQRAGLCVAFSCQPQEADNAPSGSVAEARGRAVRLVKRAFGAAVKVLPAENEGGLVQSGSAGRAACSGQAKGPVCGGRGPGLSAGVGLGRRKASLAGAECRQGQKQNTPIQNTSTQNTTFSLAAKAHDRRARERLKAQGRRICQILTGLQFVRNTSPASVLKSFQGVTEQAVQ